MKLYAVVFVPATADNRYEREVVLFRTRKNAERMQVALVWAGACAFRGKTFNCKPSQGVFVEERTVYP